MDNAPEEIVNPVPVKSVNTSPFILKTPVVISFRAEDNVKPVVVDAPLPVTEDRVSASVEVTVKLEPEAMILLIPAPVTVKLPPKETEPIPLLPIVVKLLFARLAFVIPAEPDKFAFVNPEIVLLPATIVLLLKTSAEEALINPELLVH